CPSQFACSAEGLCRAPGATQTCAEVLGDAGLGDGKPSPSAKDITSMRFLLASNPGLAADTVGRIAGTAIRADAWFATDITALKATFKTTGERVTVAGVEQVSGETANDFTHPVTYTVTARDGSTRDFIVTVAKTTFGSKVDFTTGMEPTGPAAGDLDGDGKPD